MASAHIRFATDILRRLGEELTSSADAGILELVKNSYDANARTCIIELSEVDQVGGAVSIIDDGDGMDEEGIEDGWLVLGKSSKSKERTRLDRIPAGNKGLGRLAALRMGTRTTLITRPRSKQEYQYELEINWDDYDQADLVDEVELTIAEKARSSVKEDGTEIYINNLKSMIKKQDVRRLARALILLADPFGDDANGFQPLLIAPEFKDLEKLVQSRYFSDAEYHLVAEIDGDGCAKATAYDWRDQVLFEANHKEIANRRQEKPYKCPVAQFELWIFLLSAAAFTSRQTKISEVREWLKEFGGVHIYHNGLRVNPYGNAGNDWLDMNLRRSQHPEERPSTNTVIGRVRIADPEEILVQKTDRSGFIEAEAFFELRSFAQDVLDWLSDRRLEVAEQRRARERTESQSQAKESRKNMEDALNSLPKESRTGVAEAFAAYDRTREKEVQGLRQEVQLYRTLSTAGITAATFSHESEGNPIKAITLSINAVERRAKRLTGENYSELEKPVESIKRSIVSLAVLGNTTLSLINHEKRRAGRVEVHRVIENILTTFKPFLDGRDVTVNLELCHGNPYIIGSEAALESVLTNLLNNSLTAFEQGAVTNRKVLIRTLLNDNILVLTVLDSGPGIQNISLRDIWLPGKTTRANGTGLGLTIVRDTIRDLGGEVEALPQGELGGAEFIVRLPIAGA